MCVLRACLMRSRGKTNAHNKNRLISFFFFMLLLLAAERADASTNDRLLDRDAEGKRRADHVSALFFFLEEEVRCSVASKNNKKQVGRDKRWQTFLLFTPAVRQVILKFRR